MPFGAQALSEAGEDRDLLIDLRLLDERPPAAGPIEVPLLDQVQDRLANRGEAHAQLIGILALARELLPLPEVAAFDPAQQVRPKLRVDRDSRCPTDNRLFVPHQRPLHLSCPSVAIPPM